MNNNNHNGHNYYSAFNGNQNGVNYFSGSPISYSPDISTYSPGIINLVSPDILSPQISSISPQHGSASPDSLLWSQQLEQGYIQQQIQYGATNVAGFYVYTGAEIFGFMSGDSNTDEKCPENIDVNLWNSNRKNIYGIARVPDGFIDNGEQSGNAQYHIRGVHAFVLHQGAATVLLSLYNNNGGFVNNASYFVWASVGPNDDDDGIWDASNQRLIFEFLNMNNKVRVAPNIDE